MDVFQVKLELESSQENLIQTILKNRDNLDTNTIAEAIKDFVKNHERYDVEKKRFFEYLSENKNEERFHADIANS